MRKQINFVLLKQDVHIGTDAGRWREHKFYATHGPKYLWKMCRTATEPTNIGRILE